MKKILLKIKLALKDIWLGFKIDINLSGENFNLKKIFF